MIAATLMLILAAAQPAREQAMQDIQRSHIEANVPNRDDFEKFMRRDLGAYFGQTRKRKAVPVEYELLRDGPTQSGVSYPKFYVWVRVAGGKSSEDRGAVRVAAIEKTRFEVTDFVSEEMIRRDPESIFQMFPAQVCEKITAKVTR